MKKKFSKILILLFVLSGCLLSSCADRIMGYSVLLWNMPEYSLKSGDIVPVYIKSNISHVYVAGIASGEKIEIPLWKLTEPASKFKVKSVLQTYSEYSSYYASVKLDGLPCRAEPVNTSKQVYRLRKGEVIKILYKGNGQAVMAGKTPLEGNWFKVLTDDGTQGWCFSYNLNLYEADMSGKQISGEVFVEEAEEDENWDNIFNSVWYPDSFRTMIKHGNIDLSKLHPSYNFAFDQEANKVNLNTSDIHESWDWDGYTKTDDYEYKLKNIPITIIYKNSGFIVIRYTGSSGKPEEINLVTIEQDLNEIITAEKERRDLAYARVFEAGPKFMSSSYGVITFEEDNTFRWTNFKLLVPTVIASGSKAYGSVTTKYTVNKSLSSSYDGVITFKFDNNNKEVNFLYKLEEGGLRLEDASSARFNGNLVTARGSSPLILYFRKN